VSTSLPESTSSPESTGSILLNKVEEEEIDRSIEPFGFCFSSLANAFHFSRMGFDLLATETRSSLANFEIVLPIPVVC